MNGSTLLSNYVTPDENPSCSALFRYKGVRCSQHRRVFDALDTMCNVLDDEPADIIIEIGTLYGAFTQILRDHAISAKAEIHTFDIVDTLAAPVPNVVIHRGDVFGENFSTITNLLGWANRAIVFCDGGNKEREVNTFCEHLKPRSVILCHDYVVNPIDMNDRELTGGFPSYESQWDNVKDALTKNGCIPFCEMANRRAMWGGFIKVR